MKSFVLTFSTHFKVTYYEERMLEVEDELARAKEDRRQASIQVKIYFITSLVLFVQLALFCAAVR